MFGARGIRRADAWGIAAWCTTLLTAVPLFAGSFLPFTDLPEHVASMATMHDLVDPHSIASRYYILDVARSQYVLYHALGALLTAMVGSAERANLLLLALAAVALPISFRVLLRALGRDERLALFAPMLFWNRALMIGFLPFVASIPVTFYALALVARQTRAPRRGRGIVLALLAIVLFYLHLSAYVFFSITAFVWTMPRFGRGSDWRLPGVIRRVLWMVPSGMTAIVWLVLGKMTMRDGSLADPDEIGVMRISRALHALPLWTFDIWSSHVDEAFAAIWWSAFLAFAVATLRRDMNRLGAPDKPRGMLYVPFVCASLVYLVTPFRVGAGTMLNVRLAPLIALSALLPLELAASRWNERILAGVVAASLGTSAWAAYEIWTYSHVDMAGFDALLGRMKPETHVMTLNFDPGSPRRPWFDLFAGSYHRVRGGGVASCSFAELHHWPVHYAEPARPPRKPFPFFMLTPCIYRNRTDGAYFDYVLVQGKRVDPFADEPPGPVFRKVEETPRFVLFEKVKGETFPDWDVEDQGPCVPRHP